ncbi:MAG: hypothetical protein P1P80_01005 [ANME-2 cluster archaeon]|nr:hypothetical protein [ANME-2 cluster archaeon]
MKETLHDIIYVTAIVLAAIVVLLSPYYLFPFEDPNDIAASNTLVLDIGCSRVVWVDETTSLSAAVSNMAGAVTYQWWIDGKHWGEGNTLTTTFSKGLHTIHAEANNGEQTLQKNITIRSVGSVEGISVDPIPSESYGMWRFQAYLDGDPTNIPGIQVSFNNQLADSSRPCSPANIIGVRAGSYTWVAKYHDQIVGSGTIEVPSIQKLKIFRIDIEPTYRTGDTISSILVVTNVGTQDIAGFHVRTYVLNNKYAYMGDAAAREFTFDYSKNIKPGELAQIPINAHIPEKVKGIRPTGRYTIDLEISYGSGKTTSITLYTEVV